MAGTQAYPLLELEGTETIGMAFSTDLVHWTPVRTGAFFLFLELFTLLSFYFWNFSFRSLRRAPAQLRQR